MKPFLTANWTNLINITYPVDPQILMPYLPKGVDLDIINGKAFVSVVPFDFTDTRFLGMKIPFHVNFPEINFRFYVSYKGRRGVVFINEFVSKWMVSIIANNFYYERYEKVGLKSFVTKNENIIRVGHTLNKKDKTFEVSITGENKPYFPDKESKEYFFEERFFGYSKNRDGETMEFEVKHPSWELYPVKEYNINFDFGFLYGEEWRFLNNIKPECVMLLDGSFVEMHSHRNLQEMIAENSLRALRVKLVANKGT